jgi:Zn finger protein HypA/HybF involved in hydrogenase expression
MSAMTFVTHEQAMACMTCALAGFTPESHFPQEPGLWDQPCPKCGAMTVWVTEPRPREPGT